MNKVLLSVLLLCSPLFAQTGQQQGVWEPWQFFVGSWEGTSNGQPGTGKVERDYQFVLGGKFLQVKNQSVYPAQAKNPKGETHEDWGLFSFDCNRKKFVLRQFYT